jgi:hypothetical protein
LEKDHDVSRYNLKKIKEYIGDKDRNITDMCDAGLKPNTHLTAGEQIMNFLKN